MDLNKKKQTLLARKFSNIAKKFWKNISNLDRLSYYMNIAFGLSLLMISIAFITGNYIGEDNTIISIIEILISFGLIYLGANRLWKKE